MELDELKTSLQRHFSDGLSIVVGSGLSCAEGLAGMGELASHLQTVLPTRLSGNVRTEWDEILPEIVAKGLEPALMDREPSETLDAQIATAVVELIEPQEAAVILEVISGKRKLRLSKLVPYLTSESNGIPILTTNYDRLVELACEAAQLPVDTMFDGAVLGEPNAKESRESQLRSVSFHRTSIRKRFRHHARVFKPHGSLDWYDTDNGPRRFLGALQLPRMIVTPGRRKLRRGYDSPFAAHRETINRLLDRTLRLLVLGYGFNDDHLETRLTALIQNGAPTVILTYALSDRARDLAENFENVTAIECASNTNSRVFFRRTPHELRIKDLWDLGKFVEEVFEP